MVFRMLEMPDLADHAVAAVERARFFRTRAFDLRDESFQIFYGSPVEGESANGQGCHGLLGVAWDGSQLHSVPI
jgi:hypothetical protein